MEGGKLKFGSHCLSLGRPLVMGIVNVTPDSFSDGGAFLDPDRAAARLEEMAAEGADILDIGGESTRPGSLSVTAVEELERVLPVLRRAVQDFSLPVSVDTCKAEVARAALDEGASAINDVLGTDLDPRLAEAVAAARAGLIIMHIRGVPRTMQREPFYTDLMGEIGRELADSAATAEAAGVSPESIVIDPGIGFGKTLGHNLEILRSLEELRGLGYPIMVGTSRKSFIGGVLGAEVGDRLTGTIASVVSAYHYGARLFRVHDVRQCVEALKLARAVATGETVWGPTEAAGVIACGS